MSAEESDRAWAIVLAGGRGERFGGPKQLAVAGGERLVDRSVRTVVTACEGVVLVLPPGMTWDGPAVDRCVVGGPQRADSVRAGLAAVPDDVGVVVVTDAAHPLASARLVGALVDAVLAGADGAVSVLPMLEIVQWVENGRVVRTLPKEGTRINQTPHAFRASSLRAVHRGVPSAVDDSTLLVDAGGHVVTVPGEPWNLHVASPEDLAVVDRLAAMVDATVQPV